MSEEIKQLKEENKILKKMIAVYVREYPPPPPDPRHRAAELRSMLWSLSLGPLPLLPQYPTNQMMYVRGRMDGGKNPSWLSMALLCEKILEYGYEISEET